MEEIQKKIAKDGFINHVFKFDDETKSELMNITQYVALALIPTALLHYLVESVIPDLDKTKGNVELVVEVMAEFVLILFGLFFIHRVVEYIPTYSGKALGNMNIFSIMLLFMVTRHEEESSKVKVLLKRGYEVWNGKEGNANKDKNGNQNNPVVKLTQPISGMRSPVPVHQPSRGDNMNQQPPQQQQQNASVSNDIYNSGGFGGMVNTEWPQQQQEPMAANSMGGFSTF